MFPHRELEVLSISALYGVCGRNEVGLRTLVLYDRVLYVVAKGYNYDVGEAICPYACIYISSCNIHTHVLQSSS
jgi:hypothetical protein